MNKTIPTRMKTKARAVPAIPVEIDVRDTDFQGISAIFFFEVLGFRGGSPSWPVPEGLTSYRVISFHQTSDNLATLCHHRHARPWLNRCSHEIKARHLTNGIYRPKRAIQNILVGAKPVDCPLVCMKSILPVVGRSDFHLGNRIPEPREPLLVNSVDH